ncbi:Hypothetical predicted protein [Scomber scombrus]|uniref:Uncharacterized protein n=1 Tax=Scomber scombrus TaxID=13677 RepID=A0AAV1MSF4_SCOSC
MEVTSVIHVESNVRGGDAGGGAFSSTAEVWDGGWRVVRAVMVCGCLLRSLLRPILSVTAGGSGQRRGRFEETERKINGAAGDHPLALHDAHTHTALMAFSCFLYLSLSPSFPFTTTLHLPVCLSYCRPQPVSVSFLHFSPRFLPRRSYFTSNKANMYWTFARLDPEICS